MGAQEEKRLSFERERVNGYLFGTAYGYCPKQKHVDYVGINWMTLEPVLDSWWEAYKLWESKDTFNEAFKDQRMSVRTFRGSLAINKKKPGPHPTVNGDWGEDGFEDQVSKKFKHGTISLAGKDGVRMFADSQYTPLSPNEEKQHDDIFHKTDEHLKYGANRGIDSSAFADPKNFCTRERKYEMGLHDLSASLLNPKLSIFNQIHNNEWDTQFSFVPLSQQDDQLMIFNLNRIAKVLRPTLPQLYEKVRLYRAEMTRVKLANEMDMGIGYTAVPVANPGGRPAYRLRYGLGKKTTITGPRGQQTVTVTEDVYRARQLAALNFKSILGIRDAKNEIVIAMRRHAGPFPVYAVRQSGELKCYDIVEDKMKFNGLSITENGILSKY